MTFGVKFAVTAILKVCGMDIVDRDLLGDLF
jgi:hypothetical protein